MATKKNRLKIIEGSVTAASGFRACGVKAGIKASGQKDCALIVSDTLCSAAGTFTTNAVRASSVDWCDNVLPSASIKAVFCNAGNANACTGKRGAQDTATIAKLVGSAVKAPSAESVLIASTGVIGRFLPMDKIRGSIKPLYASLDNSREGGTDFAQTIMTTDLVKKEAAVRVSAMSGAFTVGGCVKGSGMIHPNMATMLAFITSDIAIKPAALNTIVKRVVNRTFNNLTVDGDTSTNDMVLVLCNGASGISVAVSATILKDFEDALFYVCNSLCQQIAADGEGATKRVEIMVSGAKTEADARKAGKAIANSCLVKTALFGNDPNWGRILCAIGYSRATFDPDNMRVAIGKIPVCINIRPASFNVAKMQEILKQKVVQIQVELGAGTKNATIHTCDLTYDYIKINADYHT